RPRGAEPPAPDLYFTIGVTLSSLSGLRVHEESIAHLDSDVEVAVVEPSPGNERLAVLGAVIPSRFEGETTSHGESQLLIGPRSAKHIEALRDVRAWLQPRVLGLHTSAGFGDRLGLATPGHVRALRQAGKNIAPIFAQQSIREMGRTR